MISMRCIKSIEVYDMMMASWKFLEGENGVWEEMMSVTSVMNFLHGVQLVWIAMANMMDEWLMYVLPIFSSATSNIDYCECMIVSKMSVLGEKLINKQFWYCYSLGLCWIEVLLPAILCCIHAYWIIIVFLINNHSNPKE